MPYTHPIRSVPEHAHTLALEIDAQCKKSVELPGDVDIVFLAELRTLLENIDVCARFSFDRSYLYSFRVERCLSKIL